MKKRRGENRKNDEVNEEREGGREGEGKEKNTRLKNV